jgi:CRP-like cAMP-binding protein/HEAT repeat protein
MGRLRAALGRLFDIRSGEWQRLLLLYAFAFALNASVEWGDIASKALFLGQLGVDDLPQMFLADALLTAAAITFYGPFVDRISNTRLMIAICVLGSMALAFARVSLAFDLTFAYPLLYLLQSTLKAGISIHAWTYIADFYDTRTAKRHFPLISSGSRMSGILAGLVGLSLNGFFGAKSLIVAWIVALLISAWLAWITPHRGRAEAKPESKSSASAGVRQNMRDGFGFVASSGFLRMMAVAAVVGSILLCLLEYQSQRFFVSKENLASAEGLVSVYAALGTVANLITLPIQMFLLSRLVAWFGVGSANLIFPGLSAISYALLGLVPSLPTAAFADQDRKTLRSTFRTPIDGLLFNAVPLAVKGRARAFINGLLVPLGGLLAGLILLTVRQGWLSLAVLTALGLVVAATYVVVSLRLRTQYTRALVAMLEQEDFTFLLSTASDLTVTDSATLNWLTKKLEESSSSDFTIFVAKLISEVGGNKAVPILGQAARAGETRVRATIMDILVAADVRGDVMRQLYTEFLADPDGRVRRSAIMGLEQCAGSESEQFFDRALELLHDPDIDVRAQVIPPLVRSGDFFYLTSAVQTLSKLLADENPRRRACGVRVLGQVGDVRFIRNLVEYLTDADDQVRLEAAVAIESLSRDEIPGRLAPLLVEHLSSLLRDPVERVRRAAVAILERVGTQETHRGLVHFLTDPSPAVREAAVDALVRIGESVVPIVSSALDATDPQLCKMAAIVLSRINRERFGAIIESRINDSLLAIYRNHNRLEALSPCAGYAGISVLKSVLREQNQQLTDEIFYLFAAIHDPEAVEIVAESLNSETARVRANAVEALESLTTPQVAGLIAPLFEPGFAPAQLLRIGKDTWDMAHPDTTTVIRQLITDPDVPWLRTIMTFALGEIGASLSAQSLFASQEIEAMLKVSLADPVADVRLAARAAQRMIAGLRVTDATQEEETVLSTIERIIFLKGVPFFQSMTVDQLRVLADICEEEMYADDTKIFDQGDPGGALYVVVSGRVAIERAGQRKGSFVRLATIEAHSCFGEMSLLDKGPRSAAATVIQDTLTLRLRREPLVALVRQYPDLAMELINVLSQRLRAANDRIARLTRSRPRELQKLYDKFD